VPGDAGVGRHRIEGHWTVPCRGMHLFAMGVSMGDVLNSSGWCGWDADGAMNRGSDATRATPGNRLAKVIGTCLTSLVLFHGLASAQSSDQVGLWRGEVQLDSVGAPGSASVAAAAGLFRMSILIHVDDAGNASLLKQAVLVPTADGDRLLADPAAKLRLLQGLEPGALEKARLLQTAAYDFSGPTLPLSGQFAPGTVLEGQIDMPAGVATNPFAHRFHPDHDNLDDATGAILHGAAVEVYAVSRDIRIDIAPQDPDLPGPLSRIIATYGETVNGLAAAPIHSTGRLILIKVNSVSEVE
jgi:hypothetical protein